MPKIDLPKRRPEDEPTEEELKESEEWNRRAGNA